MTNFTYTDGNDVIDAADLTFVWGDRVYAGLGDDEVILSAGLAYISEPGNDTITTDGTGGAYATWTVEEPVYIDLREGWARDGWGDIDTVSGITELHITGLGGTVIGADLGETVFVFGGEYTLDLGDGSDHVLFWGQQSTDFEIMTIGRRTVVYNDERVSVLTDVEQISFDDLSINTTYDNAIVTAENGGDLTSFIETEFSPGWWYAGQYNEPQLVTHFAQAGAVFDINGDGYDDAIVPMSRGYRTGVDTRAKFQVFLGGPDGLTYSEELTEEMPFIAGSRRSETIQLANGQTALVTIAHDTAIETETRWDIPWRLGDLTIIAPEPDLDIAADILPEGGLSYTELTGRTTAVDSHALAVGDWDGDGLEDIVVGEFSGMFVLRQTATGPWEIIKTPFLAQISNGWDEPTILGHDGPMVLDMHMADFDGDGFDDLVMGWGHGDALSRVFFNDGQGGFSVENSVILPDPVYGQDSLHMKTFAEDFDNDGDLDLMILYTRETPYYGGNYFQYLRNDGTGGFTDVTEGRFDDAFPDSVVFGNRLEWTDLWTVIDVNGDGYLDIIGDDIAGNGYVMLLVNDGTGSFTRYDAPLGSGNGQMPVVSGDFDGDGKVEFLSFERSMLDGNTSSENSFVYYELSTSDFTAGDLTTTDTPLRDGDVIVGDAVADKLKGSKFENVMFGQAGNDVLRGQSGSDQLFGQLGNDRLIGGNHADRLDGGAGNDRLFGGKGKDIMIGGDGADQFVFQRMNDSSKAIKRADVIRDFDQGTDKINLRGIDASVIEAGNNAFTFVGSSGAGRGDEGTVRYVQQDGKNRTLVLIDNDDDARPEMTIVLNGLVDLTSDDFIL